MSGSFQMHNIDVGEFIKVVESCKGDVFLVTPEGDRLNLKSKLCQIVGLTRIIEGGSITEASLECALPEDETKLFRFNLYGASK